MRRGPAGHDTRETRLKPTVESLGIDLEAQSWQRSGAEDAAIEVAFVRRADGVTEWVLMRVSDDPSGRVLVYDLHEWECFLDGVRNHEFDDPAGPS
ncbi:MAG: DUF397 domain-containing protein [Streptosporangiaceae bacterium]|jgi:hypothetical protein